MSEVQLPDWLVREQERELNEFKDAYKAALRASIRDAPQSDKTKTDKPDD